MEKPPSMREVIARANYEDNQDGLRWEHLSDDLKRDWLDASDRIMAALKKEMGPVFDAFCYMSQYDDWPTIYAPGVWKEFFESQESLGPELEAVWDANADSLYES